MLEEMHSVLNTSQYNAAMATDGPVIVIAGAGAGKTKALIHRVATLLIKGVPPTNIMIVTFTNRAAGEIKDRLEGMVGENAQYITAGTFHSIVFQRMLKVFPDSRYLRNRDIMMEECSILDEDDSKSLFKTAFNNLDEDELRWADENDFDLNNIKSIMSTERSKGVTVEDYLNGIRAGQKDTNERYIVAHVWQSYNRLCREAQGIDFDDILVHADRMLKSDSWIVDALAEQFQYIMLDEYQDTNVVQMSIMDQISSRHQNIFVVGDEKQSIYGFRGADINVILSFKDRYRGATQIDMKENYRSYPAIISAANACASHMGQRLSDGQMIHKRPPGESPELMTQRKSNTVSIAEFSTVEDEAKMVADAIQRDINLGVKPNHIAVLYRNKVLKKELEKEFVRRMMDYYVVNDRSFYARAEVKDAVALLRFVYNPWDSMAGLRVLATAKLGLSSDRAKAAMAEQGASFAEILRQESQRRLKGKKKGETQAPLTAAATKLAPFYNLCRMLKDSVEYGDDTEFVMSCIRKLWDVYLKTRYVDLMNTSKKADTADEMSEKIENAKFIFDRVEECLIEGMSMRQIIEDLSMRTEFNPDVDKKSTAKVQFMTNHASKGLEYEVVYMVGCNAAVSPGDTDDENVIEEERRLFYVAMTRAEKKLVMTYPRLQMTYGEWQLTTGSPFLEEVESATGIRRMTLDKSDKEKQISVKLEEAARRKEEQEAAKVDVTADNRKRVEQSLEEALNNF